MRKRLFVRFVVVVTCFTGWFSGMCVGLPPKEDTITLAWNYPVRDPDIVFNVYHSVDLSVPLIEWELVATVTETSCTVPRMAPQEYFYVTASNVVTGLESDPR